MSLPLVLVLGYFALIGAFSLAYYFAWQYNPDCFIVHQEMNLRPLAGWRRTRRPGSGRETKRTRSAIPLEEVNAGYTVLAERERQLQANAAETAQQMITAKQELARLGKLHNEEVAANMKVRVEQRRAEYEAEMKGIQTSLEQKLRDTTADLKELGEAASTAGQAAAERFIADALGPGALQGVTNTNYLSAATEADEKYGALLRKQIDIDDALMKVRGEQQSLLEPWEQERLERLKYFDFLYFSMGVATSNTFGDIIPNQRIIRTLISVQLFGSIVILGLFLNSLSSK